MKKKLFIILFCMLCPLIFGGCAPVFDWLNFNRTTLPNPRSTVDPTLTNPNNRVENAKTQTQFDTLISQTLSAMNDTFDEQVSFTMGQDSSSYSVLYAPTTPEEPYASYKVCGARYDGTYDIYTYDIYYLYEDGFALSRDNRIIEDSNYPAYENSSNKYIYHDFLDNINFLPHQIIDKGSALVSVLNLISKNFGSIYSETENNQRYYFIDSDLELSNLLDVLFIQLPLENITERQIYFSIDEKDNKEVISGVNFKLFTQDKAITLSVAANSFGKEKVESPQEIAGTSSAYLYYANNLITDFVNQGRDNLFGYKLGKYEFFNKDGQLDYTLHCTRQTFSQIFSTTSNNQKTSFTSYSDAFVLSAVLDSGIQLHYVQSPFDYKETIYKVEVDGSIQAFDNKDNNENFNLYMDKYFRQIRLRELNGYDYQLSGAKAGRLDFAFLDSGYRYNATRNLTCLFDKDSNKLTGFILDVSNYYYEDDEQQVLINSTHEYTHFKYSADSSIVVPAEFLQTTLKQPY